MDFDTRERLGRLERRVATLEGERQPSTIASSPGKALLFWLVVLVVLAAIWLSVR